MKRFTLPMITLLVGLFLIPLDAEARRFGGGMSGGQSYATPQRQAPAPAQQRQQQQRQDGAQQNQTARPGMGGMMGGLLAGGLLAALFMGGAFEGIQLMDILLMALLGFLAFKVIKGFMKPSNTHREAYAAGNSAPSAFTPQSADLSRSGFMPQPPVSGLASGYMAAPMELPSWFDKDAFIEGASQHFTHLQRVWDSQDWDEIATYTSDEMLSLLKQERAGLAHDQHTEVVSVMAELVNFIDNRDHVVASVNFYGWLREDEGGETTEFSEIWHLKREMGEQPGNWMIVGIEQSA